MSHELEVYKGRVRAAALEVAKEQGWCREGVNEVLRGLDIEPPTSKFRVVATVTLELEVEVGDEFDHTMSAREQMEYFHGQLNGAIDSVEVSDWENQWELQTDCQSTSIDTLEPLPES